MRLTVWGGANGVPAAAAAGVLSYPQLCLVVVALAVGGIAFTTASGAHLTGLLPRPCWAGANGRLEATFWTANSTGPPLGGLLISGFGATVTVGVDAVSFLLSAAGVSRLHSREPVPPVPAARAHPTAARHYAAELTAGWRYLLAHRQLRALLLNSQVFGGCVIACSPLLAIRMLRELHFPPWQYGLALGLPCTGGILGAALARPLAGRYGHHRVLLGFGAGRALWLGLLPLAPAGGAGLAVVILAEFGLLTCAGAFNPTFSTYRMQATDRAYLARVLAAWSITARTSQPAFTAAGGLLAAVTSVRTALAVLAGLLLTSITLLPWRPDPHPAATTNPTPHTAEHRNTHPPLA